jgi:hypothetical protein
MARRPLQVVTNERRPPRKSPKGIVAAAESGDRLELLIAMRARVATAVQDPNTPARDLAALTRRLLEIANEIKAIESEREESGGSEVPDDEFDASAV